MDADTPDPYAARPSRAYVRADAEAASNAARDAQPTPADAHSRPPESRAGPDGASARHGIDAEGSGDGDEDEPLFGGTPFRDSAPGAESAPGRSEQDQAGDKDEFYALLNVDKTASEVAIKDAYKTLAIVLHPDKHPDPERKAAAEAQFRRVRAAYEVLSNPEQRAVYDHLGTAGLSSPWTVAQRGQTAAELRAEIERDVLVRRVREAEGLISSKADFAAHVDASALFAVPERVPRPAARAGEEVTWSDRWNRVGVTQLMGKHSFETQATNSSWVNFSGHMLSRNGMGGGNFVGTLKTQVSPRFSSEWTCSLLRPRILTHKGSYAVDPNTFLTYQAALQHPAAPPVLSLTFGQRISSKSYLTGFTSLRSGTWTLGPWGKPENLGGMMLRPEPASVGVGLTNQTSDSSGWTAQATLSPLGQVLSLEWGTKVLGGVKLRLGGSVGTAQGAALHATGERRVTETVRMGLGLSAGLPGPVTAKIKLNRLGQKITLPIVLAPEWRSDLVAFCALVPAVGMTALHYGYLLPQRRKRIANKLQSLRQENSETIAERRASARGARAVLREQAVKKWRSERSRGGVVIVQAWYGKQSTFPSLADDMWEEAEKKAWEAETHPTSSDLPPEFTGSQTQGTSEMQERQEPQEMDQDKGDWEALWDVRIPLQAMVQKGQLIIPGGRAKSHILGFFDPCMGEKKHLVIRYLFRGRRHEVVVDDISPVAMPLRSHQLDF